MTTEILEDKKWKVLSNGHLPIPGYTGSYTYNLYVLRLATVDNDVISFGNVKFSFIHS